MVKDLGKLGPDAHSHWSFFPGGEIANLEIEAPRSVALTIGGLFYGEWRGLLDYMQM